MIGEQEIEENDYGEILTSTSEVFAKRRSVMGCCLTSTVGVLAGALSVVVSFSIAPLAWAALGRSVS